MSQGLSPFRSGGKTPRRGFPPRTRARGRGSAARHYREQRVGLRRTRRRRRTLRDGRIRPAEARSRRSPCTAIAPSAPSLTHATAKREPSSRAASSGSAPVAARASSAVASTTFATCASSSSSALRRQLRRGEVDGRPAAVEPLERGARGGRRAGLEQRRSRRRAARPPRAGRERRRRRARIRAAVRDDAGSERDGSSGRQLRIPRQSRLDAALGERRRDELARRIGADPPDDGRSGSRLGGGERGVDRRPARTNRDVRVHARPIRRQLGADDVHHHVADGDEANPGLRRQVGGLPARRSPRRPAPPATSPPARERAWPRTRRPAARPRRTPSQRRRRRRPSTPPGRARPARASARADRRARPPTRRQTASACSASSRRPSFARA